MNTVDLTIFNHLIIYLQKWSQKREKSTVLLCSHHISSIRLKFGLWLDSFIFQSFWCRCAAVRCIIRSVIWPNFHQVLTVGQMSCFCWQFLNAVLSPDMPLSITAKKAQKSPSHCNPSKPTVPHMKLLFFFFFFLSCYEFAVMSTCVLNVSTCEYSSSL